MILKILLIFKGYKMIFYIEPKGEDTLEYLAKNGEYIGVLNSPDQNAKKLIKSDISIEKIDEKLKDGKFLVSLVFYNTWAIALIANTSDALAEIKTKYKSNQMLWYWLDNEYVKDCLPSIQYKELKKIFQINDIL